MSIPEAARVVDLERYPIHQLDSPQGAALVAGWRRELDRTGACNLQDFLTRPARASSQRKRRRCCHRPTSAPSP